MFQLTTRNDNSFLPPALQRAPKPSLLSGKGRNDGLIYPSPGKQPLKT